MCFSAIIFKGAHEVITLKQFPQISLMTFNTPQTYVSIFSSHCKLYLTHYHFKTLIEQPIALKNVKIFTLSHLHDVNHWSRLKFRSTFTKSHSLTLLSVSCNLPNRFIQCKKYIIERKITLIIS